MSYYLRPDEDDEEMRTGSMWGLWALADRRKMVVTSTMLRHGWADVKGQNISIILHTSINISFVIKK